MRRDTLFPLMYYAIFFLCSALSYFLRGYYSYRQQQSFLARIQRGMSKVVSDLKR